MKTIAMAVALVLTPTIALADDPYIALNAKQAHHQKAEPDQTIHKGWNDMAGITPYELGGPRALFFVQLRLKCTKDPRYVKVRLARITPDGLNTTGTTTWVLGNTSPDNWSGTTYWESLTKYPIKPQFKVVGGKCVAFERQFKYWMP